MFLSPSLVPIHNPFTGNLDRSQDILYQLETQKYIPQMRRYKIIAQISLVLSTFNLVLASPIVVQGKQETTTGIEMAVAEDAAVVQKKKWRGELEAASDRLAFRRLSLADSDAAAAAMASQRHSSYSDASTSSSYPTPHLSEDSSVSGYSWLLDRPPRLTLSPNRDFSVPLDTPPHPEPQDDLPPLWPWWLELLEPVMVQGSSSSSHGSASPHPSSSAESSEIRLAPPSPQFTGSSDDSDQATVVTYSPSDQFTPSYHPWSSTDGYSEESMSTLHSYLSASGGSLSSAYFSASDGGSEPVPAPVPSMPEGLAPSHHLTPDGTPPSPLSPPTETPPDSAESFNENMKKKLEIVAGVVIVGGTIASIVGSHIKHHGDYQDS